MYKYLISFIVAVFIAALIIGQCRGDDYDSVNEDDLEYVEQTSESTSTETIIKGQRNLGADINIEDKSDVVIVPEPSMVTYISDDLEIPKLTKDLAEQIVSRIGYTASYNISTKNPNWVSWHLTREHTTGLVPRYKGYLDDHDVKGYTPSEMDWYNMPQSLSHGHMCPAGDNKWDEKAMEQTFLLSNMCPQTKSLNSGSWNKLEEKCRDWSKKYGSIYIVCGPVFFSETPKTMGNAKIWIPDAFFKVILCMEGTPKAIGFVYANDEEPHNMQQSAMAVDEIEAITGIDFFYSLPDDIEDSIEAVVDFKNW